MRREKGSERWGGQQTTFYGGEIRGATTFFVSYFPENHGEKEIWRIFQRMSRVCEVFIANKRNSWGQ